MTWQVSYQPGNPIIARGSGADPDAGAVRDPCLVQRGSTIICFYTGLLQDTTPWSPTICRATSTNWGAWTKQGKVLDVGDPGWDGGGVFSPAVYDDGSRLHMFYSGTDLPEQFFGGPIDIGYAYSDDLGLTWVRGGSNPVLSATPAYAWEGGQGVYSCHVYKIGDEFYMLYSTSAPGNPYYWGLAYASAIDGAWTKFPSNGLPTGLPIRPGGRNLEEPYIFEFNGKFYALSNHFNGASVVDVFVSTCGLHDWIPESLSLIAAVVDGGWEARNAGSAAAIVDGNTVYVVYGREVGANSGLELGLATMTKA